MKLQKLQKMSPSENFLLEGQLQELQYENDKIRAAADRNAVKMCQVARQNRDYLNEIKSLRGQLDSSRKLVETVKQLKAKPRPHKSASIKVKKPEESTKDRLPTDVLTSRFGRRLKKPDRFIEK